MPSVVELLGYSLADSLALEEVDMIQMDRLSGLGHNLVSATKSYVRMVLWMEEWIYSHLRLHGYEMVGCVRLLHLAEEDIEIPTVRAAVDNRRLGR